MQLTVPVGAARTPLGRYLTLSAYWFGFSFHWFLLLPLIMPADVRRLVGEPDKATYLGILQGGLAVIPLVLPPFLGHLSDRLGRRMWFLGAGTAVNVLGLAVMFAAPTYWAYFAGYLLVQLGNSVASSPYMALIPDLVPEGERGTASGYLGLFQLVGQVAGGLAAFAFGGDRGGQYLVIALVLSTSAAVTMLTTREPARPRPAATHLPWLAYLRPEYRDFRWVFLTRFFTEFGRYAVQPFLLYYLADVIRSFRLGGIDLGNAGTALTMVFLLLSVTAAVTAVLGGRLSDRIGRKPVVVAAGATMAVAALGFALVSSFPLVVAFAMAFGLGYGAFVSVDWALGTSVLPDPSAFARDMGVWHVAMVAPQLFEGGLGRLLDAGNAGGDNGGYPVLFGIAILMFALGTVFVARIRTVR